MGIIRLLPPELVDKIAAGEVVERPASVVKELIENALDAGARHIEVTLEEGGRKLIRIADDGHGIPPEELPLAFASHATSKLAALDGLFEIATLGFRGEALASVGSVAQARILSRTRGADAGAAIADEGGHIGPVEPAAAPVGTTVEIRNLFFNVPVRRKFLKDPSTEFGHVQDVVRRYALAYLEVAFHLTHEGRRIFALPPAASLVERIRHFEGDQVADALFTVEAGDTQLGLRAAFGPPALHRGNSGLQYFFLNGRYIKDRLLYKAVADSYREMIPPRRYPVAFLFLTIDPREVDVNVHPTKLEVRFRNSWRIFQLVIGCLRSRLLKEVDSFALRPDQLAPAARPGAAALAPSPSPAAAPFASALAPSPSPAAAGEGWGEGRSAPPTASAPPHLPVNPAARQEVFRRDLDAFFGGAPAPAPTALGPSPAAAPSASALASSPSPAAAGEGRGEGMSAPPTASASPSALPLAALPVFAGAAPGRRFAQLHDSYIIEEIEDGFLIIDQHALHERMLYEDFRARLAAGRIARQRLLLPAVIDLTPTQTESLEGCGAALAAIGFEIEPFGKQQIALQAVPDFLGKHDAGRVLGEFLDAFAEEERPRTPAELLDASLEMMACKAAVKAGDRLSEPELRHLLALRARYEHTLTCPHGRPTTLKLSLSDLEKHFHRT